MPREPAVRDRLDDGALVDVLRRRRLDEDAMNRRVCVQLAHDREELLLRGRVLQLVLHAVHSEITRRLFLAPHVGVRRRIIADDHHRKPRPDAARHELRDFAAGLVVDALREIGRAHV